MIFADNSVRRHIVKKALIGINETHCGQYYSPCYGSKDDRAAVKMPLCKTCKRMAMAALKRVEAK